MIAITTRISYLSCLILVCVVAKVKAFIPSIRQPSTICAQSLSNIQSQKQHLQSSKLETEDISSTSTPIDISSLPLPPNNGMNLFRNIRDTFSYLASPQRFISKRYKQLGPTFLAYQFFKPMVFVGNMTLVTEYVKNAERENEVIYPSLPDTFLELHSKWGSLNLDSNDEVFKQSRMLFTDILSNKEALSMYTKVLEEKIEAYVASIETRIREDPETPIYLVPELISLNLDMFASIFSGKGLTKEQEQMFVDYNAGLLSLSKNSKQWVQAKEAFDDLKVEMLKRFREMDDMSEEDLTVPGKFVHGKLAGREGFEDIDRISAGIVLFIWGAYIECASLMATSLARISATKQPSLEIVQNLCNEMNDQLNVEGSDVKDYSFWSDLSYSLGVCRESLRLIPPVSGLPKFSKKDYQLGEYRIPAEVPVCLEPRIVNQDPSKYKCWSSNQQIIVITLILSPTTCRI